MRVIVLEQKELKILGFQTSNAFAIKLCVLRRISLPCTAIAQVCVCVIIYSKCGVARTVPHP